MTSRQVRFGWNWPGTMMRLGLHTGAGLAWVFYGLPLPVLAVGSSVGALVLACLLSFDKKDMHRMAKLVANLKREQIFTLSQGLIRTCVYLLCAGAVLIIAAAAAGALGPAWAFLLIILTVIHAFMRFRGNTIQFYAMRGILLIAVVLAGKFVAWPPAIAFWIGVFLFDWLIRRALHIFFRECESPLDTAPLFKLLRNNLSFRHIFSSPTELRIITTDITTPGVYVISNRDAGKDNPDNSLHCDRFTDGIRAATALPGRFPFIHVDGRCLRDSECWTAFPLKQFAGQNIDLVFRFDYWDPLEYETAPTTWFEDLFRCFDVMRDKNTWDKMESYDLRRKADPQNVPRIVYIRMSEKLRRQVPKIAVNNFKPGQLWKAIRVGYRIIRENLPLIRRELGLDHSGGESCQSLV